MGKLLYDNVMTSGARAVHGSVYAAASSRPVLMDDVHCTGTEDTILDCSHSSIGNHFCSKYSPNENLLVVIQCKSGALLYYLKIAI